MAFPGEARRESMYCAQKILRAEDLPRGNKLPGAQLPVKRANIEKYTFQVHRCLSKFHYLCGVAVKEGGSISKCTNSMVGEGIKKTSKSGGEG